MLKKAVSEQHRAVLSAFLLPVILVALILTTACSQKGGASASEDHSVYEGNGTLVTRVNVAIQSGDKLLYVGSVRVIDDKPTVWKALMGISRNDKVNLTIDKNADGQIVGVRESLGEQAKEGKEQQEGQEQQERPAVQWTLFLENQPIAEPYNVENLEVTSEIGVTLYGEMRDK